MPPLPSATTVAASSMARSGAWAASGLRMSQLRGAGRRHRGRERRHRRDANHPALVEADTPRPASRRTYEPQLQLVQSISLLRQPIARLQTTTTAPTPWVHGGRRQLSGRKPHRRRAARQVDRSQGVRAEYLHHLVAACSWQWILARTDLAPRKSASRPASERRPRRLVGGGSRDASYRSCRVGWRPASSGVLQRQLGLELARLRRLSRATRPAPTDHDDLIASFSSRGPSAFAASSSRRVSRRPA